jgi:hypothetical protein
MTAVESKKTDCSEVDVFRERFAAAARGQELPLHVLYCMCAGGIS